MEEFDLPEFLLAEFPIKKDDFNKNRLFIIHKGISLIEVISHELYEAHITFDDKVSKQFIYFDEEFTLVYHTNNVDYFGENPLELLTKAFEWYREYLIWEDTQEEDDDEEDDEFLL